MEVLDVYITVLLCVASYPHCSHGSTKYVTRALSVGDDLTLDCVTDWDPNIELRWIQTRQPENYRHIAKAGKNYPRGEIYDYFRNDSRISYSFVNTSSNDTKLNLELHISSVTVQDSEEYTCTLTNVKQDNTMNVHFYYISVITCKCSVDEKVKCDLHGFDSPRHADWLPVSISLEGRNINTTVTESSFTFYASHLSDLTKRYSVRVSSSDGFLSHITCTLAHQQIPSSTLKTTTVSMKPRSSSEQMITTDVSKEFASTTQTTVHSCTVRDESQIPSVTTKLSITRPSVFSTTQTDTTPTSQSPESNNMKIIIVISLSISVGVAILVVIIVMQNRKRNYKSNSVRGKITLQRGRERSPEANLRLQTRSTSIPDFTFQNSAMKTCHLHNEESTDDHYYSSVTDNHVNGQNGLSTDNLNGRNLNSRDACERSDYRVDLSDKESAENIKHTRKVIPMEELNNLYGQDTADRHLYFVLENDDKTHCFPNQDPCTSSCSRYEASVEVMVDNILYQSSDVIPMKTTTGPSEQKADDAHLYFVHEDNSKQSCSSDNPCSALPLLNSHQNKDSGRCLSGHLYEEIDSRFHKEITK